MLKKALILYGNQIEIQKAIQIMQACVDVIETIIIGKQPLLEDPLFDSKKYQAVKSSSNFDSILKYIEGRYDILQLLSVSNETIPSS